MRVTTGAKINLYLKVESARADGYHEVDTVYHSVDLVDAMWVGANPAFRTEVSMEAAAGSNADLPSPDDNLAHRAVELLRRETGKQDGVSIEILKRIPIAAGLAGGSGNAAGVLLSLDGQWDLGLTPAEIQRIGSALGSDVPYCLQGGTVRARGRGEELETLTPFSAWFVLAIASQGLSTASVYEAWDEHPVSDQGSAQPMIDALAEGDVSTVASLLHNDLEAAVFDMRPELEDGKRALTNAGALGALVSGSGPTLFGICASRGAAMDVAAGLEGRFDRIEVTRSARRCVELDVG